MQFIFESLFKTHKILRKDLECLPLFVQFINNSFDEKFYLKNLGIEKKDPKFYLKNLGIEKKDPKHFTIRKNHACCLSFGFRG